MVPSSIYYYMILFILIQVKSIQSNLKSSNRFTCVLRNLKYSNEYLYASNNYDLKTGNHQPFTNDLNLKTLHSFKQAIWIIDVINSSQHTNRSTFFLRNFFFTNENLCATDKHKEKTKRRRLVNLAKVNSTHEARINNLKCIWELKHENKIKGEGQVFSIWNSYYNEPLYSPVNLFSKFNSPRILYLWHKKPDSKQFYWDISCDKSF